MIGCRVFYCAESENLLNCSNPQGEKARMSVKVELVFNSVDEAIVALGKIVGTAATVRGETPEKRERKGRSDAGKPRGPYNKDTTTGGPSPASVEQPVAAGTSPVASASPTKPAAPEQAAKPAVAPAATAPSGTVAAAPAAAVPTPEQVQTALEKLFNAKGFEDCALLLSRYGAKRGKDLKPEQRAEFIAHAEGVVAGTKKI